MNGMAPFSSLKWDMGYMRKKLYDYLCITIDLVIHIFLCFSSSDIDYDASITYGAYHWSFPTQLNRRRQNDTSCLLGLLGNL